MREKLSLWIFIQMGLMILIFISIFIPLFLVSWYFEIPIEYRIGYIISIFLGSITILYAIRKHLKEIWTPKPKFQIENNSESLYIDPDERILYFEIKNNGYSNAYYVDCEFEIYNKNMGCVAWGGCHCIKNFHKDSDFIFSPHILKGKSKKFLGYINENLDSAKYLIYIDINCSRCSTRIKRIYNLTRNIIIPNGSILYNPPL